MPPDPPRWAASRPLEPPFLKSCIRHCTRKTFTVCVTPSCGIETYRKSCPVVRIGWLAPARQSLFPAYPARDVCRASLYHCFLALREPYTMQIAQNICSRLLHKHTPTINGMLTVNSERCKSLGLLTRTGFAAEVYTLASA